MPSRIAPPPVSTMPELSALLVAGAPDLVPHQMEDFLGARLEDLRQDAPRHHARLAAADAGDLDRVVLVDHRRQRASALALDLFRVGHRRPQADGDVVGEVIAADADDAPCARGCRARRWRCPSCRRRCRRARRRAPSRPRVSTDFARGELLDDGVGDGRRPRGSRTRRCSASSVWLPVTMWTFTSSRAPVIPTGAPMPSCSSTTKSCGSTWRISRPVGSDTAFAASIARRTSSRVISRFLPATAMTPRLLKPLMCGPDSARCTESISTPAISSASSIAFLIDSTAASRLTTTPRLMPRDSATPRPTMSRPRRPIGHLADDGRHLRRADVEPDQISFSTCHSASGSRPLRLVR